MTLNGYGVFPFADGGQWTVNVQVFAAPSGGTSGTILFAEQFFLPRRVVRMMVKSAELVDGRHILKGEIMWQNDTTQPRNQPIEVHLENTPVGVLWGYRITAPNSVEDTGTDAQGNLFLGMSVYGRLTYTP